MKFRTKVSVYDRASDFDRPLALSFKNLAEDSPGEQVFDSWVLGVLSPPPPDTQPSLCDCGCDR